MIWSIISAVPPARSIETSPSARRDPGAPRDDQRDRAFGSSPVVGVLFGIALSIPLWMALAFAIWLVTR